MNLLIAEDDLISRRILEKTLTDLGHQPLVAVNGLEAWELIQQHEVQVVISDWVMPEADGLYLCQLIRKAHLSHYIYLILLTSKDGQNDLLRGLEAGADDYLIKPFDLAELKARLKTAERVIDLEKKLVKKNKALSLLNKKLKDLSRVDDLMQIGNRRSFHEAIIRVHDLAQRYRRSYGVIMADVDHFKAYNDRYGHQAGDRLLITMADICKKIVRKSDEVFRIGEKIGDVKDDSSPKQDFPDQSQVFRFGGEEIVFLLPEQNCHGAAIAAERIRLAVQNKAFEHQNNLTGQVTISCGVACYQEKDRQKKWEDILERADQALYLAKQAGRNCVKAFEDSPLSS